MYGVENVDKKASDVFSLGMIFYQILFRQEPAADDSGQKRGSKNQKAVLRL